jgi:hypothetical protein
MDPQRSEGAAMSGMNMGPTVPTDILEVRAAEQRRRLHESVLELRTRVEDKLDVRKHAAEYVWPASGVAAGMGLLMGWAVSGLFSSPRR